MPYGDEICCRGWCHRHRRGQKKQAINVITELCLFEADKRSVEEQDILVNEIKNAFLKFIDVSRNGRGFTSIVFGMGQLSDESVTKKLQNR